MSEVAAGAPAGLLRGGRGARGGGATTGSKRGGEPVTRLEALLLAGVTILAAVLRVWRLDVLPPGLHVDEAFNILDARSILHGAWPVFLAANAGREVLYSYLQAPFLGLLGESARSARLASALAGTLAVPAVWLLARRVRLGRTRSVALVAAALTAVSFWPLFFSRVGIRAVLFVPVAALAGAAWATIVTCPPEKHARGATAALALLLSAAVYTHPAGRALVVLPGLQALYMAIRGQRRPLGALALAAVGGLVLALPVAAFWARHPTNFSGHVEEVSIVSAGPAAVAANVARVAGMFNVAGDPAPWRNLVAGVGATARGRPVFDLVTGLLFLVGLAWTTLRAAREPSALLVVLWLVGLLVPSVLADGAPNFSRAIGAVPFALLLAALGLDRVLAPVPRRAAVGLAVGWVAVAGVLAARDYFVRWAEAPETPLAFDADKVALGRAAGAASGSGATVFVSAEMGRHPTVIVAAGGEDVRGYTPRDDSLLAPAGHAEDWFLLPGEAGLEAAVGAPADGVAPPTWGPADAGGSGGDRLVDTGIAAGLRRGRMTAPADADLLPGAPRARAADFAGLALIAARFPSAVAPGAIFTPTLAWRVTGTLPPRQNGFVHVRSGDATAAQHDGPALGGDLGSESWRVGERLITHHPLQAPGAPGVYELVTGWYDWRTLDRLPLAPGTEGAVDDGTALRLGTFEVRP